MQQSDWEALISPEPQNRKKQKNYTPLHSNRDVFPAKPNIPATPYYGETFSEFAERNWKQRELLQTINIQNNYNYYNSNGEINNQQPQQYEMQQFTTEQIIEQQSYKRCYQNKISQSFHLFSMISTKQFVLVQEKTWFDKILGVFKKCLSLADPTSEAIIEFLLVAFSLTQSQNTQLEADSQKIWNLIESRIDWNPQELNNILDCVLEQLINERINWNRLSEILEKSVLSKKTQRIFLQDASEKIGADTLGWKLGIDHSLQTIDYMIRNYEFLKQSNKSLEEIMYESINCWDKNLF